MYNRRAQDDQKEKSSDECMDFRRAKFNYKYPTKEFENCHVLAAKFGPKGNGDEYLIRKEKTTYSRLQETSFETESETLRGELSNDNSHDSMISLFKINIRGKVGYVSLVMLILFTFFNFALEFVDAQIHRIDSPLLYDTFSMEVISPPFHYKKLSNVDKQRMGLGSAAISSVTEALSPILPFTGGVDLRRQEHWDTTRGWMNTASSMINQIGDAFGLQAIDYSWYVPRGGDQFSSMENGREPKSGRSGKLDRVTTLSASEPFVHISLITEMTLIDLTGAFLYAIESSTSNFSQSSFFESVNPRMIEIITSLQDGVEMSRGVDVAAAKKTPNVNKSMILPGDIDALKFCAAMRLFAEWRVVRQVPDGYKGFAIGMTLGHKDVIQNIAKIENAVHDWIDYQRRGEKSDRNIRSPTLRQLLEFEVQMNVHGKNRLPRLKDKTAGMGLLWVRRQLHYQTALFANVMEVSKSFKTTNDAVSAAYSEVYDKFHGWAVQKIFNYSFQAAPEPEVIYRFMNPHHLRQVMRQARDISAIEDEEEKETLSEVEDVKNDGNIFQKVGKHIEGEWSKIVKAFARKTDSQTTSETKVEEKLDIEDFVTLEMTKAAHHHISEYVKVIRPLLKDLNDLFEEMNMDDPTKV